MYIQYQDAALQLEKWWNDGKVMAWAGFPNGLHTSVNEIIDELKKEDENIKKRHMIIYHDLKIVEMNYHVINQETVEIGIKICDFNYQEQGLGRIILSLFIQSLFQKGFQKIILDTNLKNKRAQHVYELLGFKQVAIRYDCWRDREEILQSAINYKLIPSDFHNYAL